MSTAEPARDEADSPPPAPTWPAQGGGGGRRRVEAYAPADHETARVRRRQRVVALALATLTVLPVLLVGVDGWRRGWFPAGDWAMTELRGLDVGTRHTPLVGAYSRYSWNHPGPLLFWVLAVPYRLLGRSSSSLLLGAAIVNAASVAGMLALAWRRGRLALLAGTAVALSVCVFALSPALLRDPWNAWVSVLPFGLLVLAAWSALEGDRAALVVLAVVGAFLTQTHIGFAPLVAVLTVVGAVGYLRRSGDRRGLVVAAAVAALCWLPVLVDVVTGGDNVAKIVAHFAGDNEPVGLGRAVGVAARELAGRLPWTEIGEPVNPMGGGLESGSLLSLAAVVLLFAGAGAVAWMRRDVAPAAWRFQAVVGAAALTGVLAVSRISGEVFDYLVRWWWPLAALWWLAAAWSVSTALGPRARRWLAPVGLVAAFLVVARLGVAVVAPASEARLPVDDWGPAMAAVGPAAARQLPLDRPVLVRNVGPLSGWAGDAFSVQAARQGVDVRVDDTGINRYKFGAHRLSGAAPSFPAAWVVTGSWIPVFAGTPQARLLAAYDPLPPAERSATAETERALRGAFRAAGRDDFVHALDEGLSLWGADQVAGVDRDALARYEDARQRGVPVSVYVFDDATTPLPDPPA